MRKLRQGNIFIFVAEDKEESDRLEQLYSTHESEVRCHGFGRDALTKFFGSSVSSEDTETPLLEELEVDSGPDAPESENF